MVKIFLSYRRADSEFVADSIYNEMQQHFGEGNVFLDVGEIPFGVDFRVYLREQIAAHDVILVLIGPKWAEIMHERASQANDFVRIEIEHALSLNKLVIPVLVMRQDRMPDFSNLPASIQDLQWRNVAQIRREPDFKIDCQRIATNIHKVLGTTPAHSKVLDILPAPFEWIEIPAGNVTLITEKGWAKNYIAEGSSQSFNVPTFEIAKYPITHAQYRTFIEAGGYSNRAWWTEAGWLAKQAELWTNPDDWSADQPDLPVVGVSWHECMAFCRWLSEVTGETIQLPTEQQWQRAAQGDDNRAYPWGNRWDANRCNNDVDGQGNKQTTPIRYFEGRGDSRSGVVDLAGNVWEWCLTAYETGSTSEQGSDARVLRGGSWSSTHPASFTCTYRARISPQIRSNNGGFRIVRLQ